ncbi:MFS transporter [Rhizobium sp. ACO-34A]|nr:MFS transporter [Rhizobium sp. ACO-34A]ATN33790.1 MFS transporter [Rhizobium sp. ACO-34A]
MSATDLSAASETGTLISRIAVILTVAMFGLTYSLSAPLIALEMVARGASQSIVGANAAMHAIGVLVVALVLPGVASKAGPRRLILLSLVVSAAVLVAIALVDNIWLWFPLRLLLGMAAEALFVLSETWINALSTESTRARFMAVYTAALSLGLALGPLLLSLIGSHGTLPFMVGAVIALAAASFVLLPMVRAPAFEKPSSGNPLRFLRLAPVAIGAIVLNAAVETAGLSFLALYAVGLGWNADDAAQLMFVMMGGAILLQLPIGWLGDLFDRRKLVLGCALVAAVGAALWPWALAYPFATYALLFVWGGVFVGIYTLTLTIVGSRFSGGDLVGIYALMGLAWGAGALVGPLAAGVSLQIGTHGLPVFTAIACLVFALVVTMRREG